MAKRKPKTKKVVETIIHDEASRKNIPTAEYQSVMRDDEKDPIRVAYERRNRDLDPQLVWRGKDEQDWSDLVVQAPPLYIQEKVHPKILIDDLRNQTEKRQGEDQPRQLDLFGDFNGLPDEAARTEFYQHDANWSNRMILGDSLQVMASLAEREGLRGKVQCIYLDPPYGIKFNSNFQWSTTSRDVKDGNKKHITREPEQVKAFRDTWRDGIHSYLTYLRDRLTVCRDLLTDSGSIFVQIGDENVHRVRCLMDEVFGEENCCCQIIYATTSSQGSNMLPVVNDNILWFIKDLSVAKYRRLFNRKKLGEYGTTGYTQFEAKDNTIIPLSAVNDLSKEIKLGGKVFASSDLTSSHYSQSETIRKNGKDYTPKNRFWSTSTTGMYRLSKSDRLLTVGNTLRYKRYLQDFDVLPLSNIWSEQLSEQNKSYVVQTASSVIKRCILMTTDPGDLVLDPTCGSGTTAYVAEQWGRRWITIDTSRVALALARARIMGARYPFYLLADSPEGQQKEAKITRTIPSESPTFGNIRQGFVYQRVPHITLKAIANNTEIDVIWDKFQQTLEPLREQLNKELQQGWQEWEIPREAEKEWSSTAKQLHKKWWQNRIARQKEIDASIAARADFEYLYDKPYEDRKKVRVAGPFTVESLSPHRVLGVNENEELIDPLKSDQEDTEQEGFVRMILDNLKTAGVQQAHKEDKINFSSLSPWPGKYICAEGRYLEGEQETGTEKRAAIFIGPEFGTVSRPDLVAAAREAGDAGFDALIACAFNYDAHSSEFDKLGRIPVLKARMNADLHMADDLKNTGKGNLFVIFGEPDITVVSGQWLVSRNGRMVANYDYVKELSGLGSLEEINRVGRDDLLRLCTVPAGRKIRDDQSNQTGGGISAGQHRGGGGTQLDKGISPVSGDSRRFPGRDRNFPDSGREIGHDFRETDQSAPGTSGGHWSDAQRTKALAALKNLSVADFPLALTTDHKSQVTIHGVDVFHPNTGEVRSDNADGIACWFIDTDYNEESFFVRHAYFLGANDPYKALKTTLKAEIDKEAWDTLHSDISRPFNKPESGRIAVKVINHLGDEVMKVYQI